MNPFTRRQWNATISSASMQYDDDDRITTWNGQSATSDPDGNLTLGPINGALASLGFDARNRLSAAGGVTYTYDSEGHRTSMTHAGSTSTFVQDPQGALSRLLQTTTSSATTRCVYAGDRLLYDEVDGQIRVYPKPAHPNSFLILCAAPC